MRTDQYGKDIIWFKGRFWVNASKEQTLDSEGAGGWHFFFPETVWKTNNYIHECLYLLHD